MELIWEKPPVLGEKARELDAKADVLRQHPGRSAKVAEGGPSVAGRAADIRNGKGSFAPAGSFHAQANTISGAGKDAVVAVYAWYKGEDGKASPETVGVNGGDPTAVAEAGAGGDAELGTGDGAEEGAPESAAPWEG